MTWDATDTRDDSLLIEQVVRMLEGGPAPIPLPTLAHIRALARWNHRLASERDHLLTLLHQPPAADKGVPL